MRASLENLNEYDAPERCGGERLSDDGQNQLWAFGSRFANRLEVVERGVVVSVTWSDNIEGWGLGEGARAID